VTGPQQRGLVVGCGYLGQRVATAWRELGWDVSALTRSSQRAEELAGQGLTPRVGDVTDPGSLAGLSEFADADVVLFAVGRDRERTSQTMREVSLDGLRNVIDVLVEGTVRFVFISSTGVYGQSEGEWVDESSPTEPTRENGRVLVESEAMVRGRLGSRSRVLRLAGFYGPSRLIARRDSLMAGHPLGGNPEAWLNLVHVDDATRAVVSASTVETFARDGGGDDDGDAAAVGGTWLVCDDRPVQRKEYFGRLAKLCGAPPPTFDPARDSPRIDGLGKRCRNQRMKDELRVELQYPDIESGLPAALSGEILRGSERA